VHKRTQDLRVQYKKSAGRTNIDESKWA
jgi:hypothetical protein